MAPSQPLSQLSSTQSKKQQTISSFFTSKPTTAAPKPAPGRDRDQTRIGVENEGDEEEEVRSTFRQSLKRHLETDSAPEKRSRRRTSEPEGADDLAVPDAAATGTTNGGGRVLETARSADLNGARRIADRTSRFLFSSSPTGGEENHQAAGDNEDDGEGTEESRRKETLHRKFVKKLGRPDSIAEIKRRNWVIDDPTGARAGGAGDEDDADEEQEEAERKKAKGKGKGAAKLTPMERQIVELKRKHLDAVLLFEVGYKFRFFGEDARIAAKVLHIVCIPGKMRYDEHPSEAHLDRFASASFPVARLHVHVKRLVAAGHKVGVVRQIETAALKAAGDNRNAPFVRKLTNMYTKGTYIDDVEGLEGPAAATVETTKAATGYLLCLTESSLKGGSPDEKVRVGIVAVQPTTGDIIYDDFEDGFMRGEIESRLLHIAPCEFLIVGELSPATNKLVQHLSGTNLLGEQARVERVTRSKTTAAEAYSHVSKFYADKAAEVATLNASVLDQVHDFSEDVTVCLSALITHLGEYGLEHVFRLQSFQPFSTRSHMLLNGNTLTSLEIYQSDGAAKGSLFWCLDRTKTRFGQRLLRKWVGRPLLDRTKLEARIEAVEELKRQSMPADKIKYVLRQIKNDLEKSLIRIYYQKCTRPELLVFLQTLQKIATEYANASSNTGFKSALVRDAIIVLAKVPVVGYLEQINSQAAKENDKYTFFREEHETEDISNHKLGIAAVEADLEAHRAVAAAALRKKTVEYVKSSGIDYLIQVDNTQLRHVPASWAKISGTKKLSRFHTPDVVRLLRERDQHKEALAAACDEAFAVLLADIAAQHYQVLRDCVQALATLDCLLSLAEVAAQPGYVAPTFDDAPGIHVSQGRHPMVEQLLLDAYVPNDIALAGWSASSSPANHDDPRALLITGPNMGGKSSYVRQVALIAILAQIGSHVPAASARLGLVDAVFTRMGASDNMLRGESTFMVELAETATILRTATPRSLVLLDELGRGTSTHDGVAIAEAVLRHVVADVRCMTLFITHYQALSRLAGWGAEGKEVELARGALGALKNVHMRFEEQGEDVTFLYEVGEGVAHRSYGLNVARLANVPKPVLDVAAVKSREMEASMRRKKLASLTRGFERVLREQGEVEDDLEMLVSGVEQL